MNWIKLTIAGIIVVHYRCGLCSCAVMVLSALVLEGEAHARVLDSQVGQDFWRRAQIT